jgi:nitroimidazol reductase NimA-like FMN-containing flavoprotein (pyridoxamine 5'-phosphate oxidase superfamily)
MSSPPQVRRTDRMMSEPDMLAFLSSGYCGRLATFGADGYPYCLPLLYVCMDGEVYVHNTAARGHLRINIEHEAKICFEIDEAGEVFDYGRFECDSALVYRSVIVFGNIRVIEDRDVKQRFCDELMKKYGKADTIRPKGFYPRLDDITIYGIAIERITGKELALPPISEQWPALDRTKSPNARV